MFYINKELKKSYIIDYLLYLYFQNKSRFYIFNCSISIFCDTINVFKERWFQIDKKIRKYKL